MLLVHSIVIVAAYLLVVSRVSFTQAMYNGEEGSVVEVCAEISNPVAMQASIALTVSNAVAGYDNAESNVLIDSLFFAIQLS